jgi:papain like cysteine protease AvrRpt2
MLMGNTLGGAALVRSNRLGPAFGVEPADTSDASTQSAGGIAKLGSGGLPRLGSGGIPRVGSGGIPRVGSGRDWLEFDSEVIAVVLGPGALGGRLGPTMAFRVDTQEETNWCWAAVTSAVDRYYHRDSFLTQCEVVARTANGADACLDPDEHNTAGILDQALKTIGVEHFVDQSVPFHTLQTEIDAGRPVCVAIDWVGGGSHFVVLCGYQLWTDGTNVIETVDVADPFYADSTCIFSSLTQAYQGLGKWAQTYLTNQ